MFGIDSDWLKRSLKTRQGVAGALTCFVPIALVLGPAPVDITVSITAILFLADCLFRRNWAWTKAPWVSVLLILWAYTLGRAAFIPDGGRSLFAAFTWLRYIFFAASTATWALKDEKWRSGLLRIIIACVLYLSIDTFIQYAVGVDIFGHPILDEGRRLTASFVKPIVGITIASIFAPALFWLIDRKRPLASAGFGVAAFLAVLLSGDRMGLLFALCVIILWLFMLLRSHRRLWPVLVGGVCICAIILATHPILFQRQVESSAKVIENIKASPYGLAWTSGLHVGEAYPIFGVGMRQFRYACTEERFGPLTDAATGYPRCYVHPHNAYMEWFSEEGAIGLGGFIAFGITLFVALARRLMAYPNSMLLWGLGITLAVRLMPFYTSTSFFNNWSAIPFWLCVGWAMQEGDPISAPETSKI